MYIGYHDFFMETKIKKFVNDWLSFIVGYKLIRSNNYKLERTAKKLFKNRFLKYSEDGYYFVDPMPNEQELYEYYKHIYWNKRNSISNNNQMKKDHDLTRRKTAAKFRDFVHNLILKKYIPNYLKEKKTFLNFGSGDFGLSLILWTDGLNIKNVEPSHNPKLFDNRWETFKSLEDVEDNSVDIFYSSHSLEHVANIESFIKNARRITKSNSALFFEVPNANSPKVGAKQGKITIPHTYYFENKFFENLFDEIILNQNFFGSELGQDIEGWEDYSDNNGDVIRAIGKFY